MSYNEIETAEKAARQSINGTWPLDWAKRGVPQGTILTTTFIVLAALIPFFGTAGIPVMTNALLFLTLCYAWNLVGGFLGELSLAHMIFWGIGSYGIVL